MLWLLKKSMFIFLGAFFMICKYLLILNLIIMPQSPCKNNSSTYIPLSIMFRKGDWYYVSYSNIMGTLMSYKLNRDTLRLGYYGLPPKTYNSTETDTYEAPTYPRVFP